MVFRGDPGGVAGEAAVTWGLGPPRGGRRVVGGGTRAGSGSQPKFVQSE